MSVAPSTPAKKARFSSVDLMLIAMSLIWGINFTAIKGALATFSPLSFNAIRFASASLLLLSFLWIRERNFGIKRKDLGRFVLLALVGNVAYQLFFINGIALTSATDSALILATTPIFIVIFSALLRVEKTSRRVVLGIVSSFLGVAIIILGSGQPLTLSSSSLMGDLLIVANPSLLGALHRAFEAHAQRVLTLKADNDHGGDGNCALSAGWDSVSKFRELGSDFNPSMAGSRIFSLLRHSTGLRFMVHGSKPHRQRKNRTLRILSNRFRRGDRVDSPVRIHDCHPNSRRSSSFRKPVSC